MTKPRKSILDPFAADLAQWQEEGVTIEAMVARLAERGCRTVLSTVSNYLAKQRQRDLEGRVLQSIRDGSQRSAAIRKEFAKHPAPGMEQLCEHIRLLVQELQIQGVERPDLLKVADSLFRTLMVRLQTDTQSAALKLQQNKFMRENAEAVLKSANDAVVQRIAASPVDYQEKLEAVGRHLFGDLWDLHPPEEPKQT